MRALTGVSVCALLEYPLYPQALRPMHATYIKHAYIAISDNRPRRIKAVTCITLLWIDIQTKNKHHKIA